MQVYIFLAMLVGWGASLGLVGWKAHEMGQGQCQLEVVKAAQNFMQRRKIYLGRLNARNLTRAEDRADKGELRNDRYEQALDVIELYGVQMKSCEVPGEVREAIGKIR